MTPYGYCLCGCGQKTEIAKYNRPEHGYVKGEPRRYRVGHNAHKGHNPKPERRPIDERDYTVDENGCWIWNGVTFGGGYAQTKMGKERYAHRAMWRQRIGSLPDGHLDGVIHHTCKVKNCVNPDHLVLISPKEHKARHKV